MASTRPVCDIRSVDTDMSVTVHWVPEMGQVPEGVMTKFWVHVMSPITTSGCSGIGPAPYWY